MVALLLNWEIWFKIWYTAAIAIIFCDVFCSGIVYNDSIFNDTFWNGRLCNDSIFNDIGVNDITFIDITFTYITFTDISFNDITFIFIDSCFIDVVDFLRTRSFVSLCSYQNERCFLCFAYVHNDLQYVNSLLVLYISVNL